MSDTVAIDYMGLGDDGYHHAMAVGHAGRRASGWGLSEADAESHARERIAPQLLDTSVQTLVYDHIVVEIVRDQHVPTNNLVRVLDADDGGWPLKRQQFRPSDSHPTLSPEEAIQATLSDITRGSGRPIDVTGAAWWNGREYIAARS